MGTCLKRSSAETETLVKVLGQTFERDIKVYV